jgi:diguanylate cyclase (GGDEF)-like protein
MHQQQQSEAQIRHQAFHDGLTGLANRSLFYDRLEHALELGHREPRSLAVLLIDLDRFKPINDSLGHAAGDQLLVAVADRIAACLRSNDSAGRLGGDEFVVLAEGVTSIDDAGAVAQRVLDSLAEPLVLAGAQVSVRASIGVAFAEIGTGNADELLNNADAAMYAAKRTATGTYRVFEPSMHASMQGIDHIGLDAEINRALSDGELVVHYQPISSVQTGKISSVEALVRWQHPQRGLLPPAEFVPAAEASGSIVDIGSFVLREACRQVKSWQDMWAEEQLQLNVNLSARELAEADLVSRVAQILRETGLDPSCVTLELTETALLVDPVQAAARLRALRKLGVRLAVDDFGTGFSSLTHLRRLPVDTLKIDKSFVDTIATDSDGFEFIQGIVRLAHTLRLTTVAEGVEEPDQLRGLQLAGCDLMQGYLLARPLTPADVEALIRAGRATEEAVQFAAARR